MRRNRWRGTILFAVILVVMGSTVGLKLYGLDQAPVAGSPASASPVGTATGAGAAAPSATAGSTPQPSASDGASAPPATASRVITGSVEQTRYGPIQVQVTFEGPKITNVRELQSPDDERRSVSINEQASPLLLHEVLSSQSARIDTVSGATYTSDGYKQSLQSAIDQL